MSQLNKKDFFHKLKQQLGNSVFLDSLHQKLYATDASAYQEIPAAVVVPKNSKEILRVIQFAKENKIGVIPRTAGTSLAGQVVGAGIVVDVSKHLNQILEINQEQRWCRVQPGVIRDELNRKLSPLGLLFGPETSTANRAMIGGMMGNNSCGSNSVVYGSTRDHVLSVSGYMSDGSFVTFQKVDQETFEEKCQLPSLEGEVYRRTRDMLAEESVRQEIRDQFPKTQIPRRNTGYALDLLAESNVFDPQVETEFDFCKLLSGSEGTLFFTTEIKLNLLPLPPKESVLQCAHFPDVDSALRATLIALQFSPYAVELIDQFIIEGAMRNSQQKKNADFIEGEPGAILVTDIRADSLEEATAQATKLEERLRAAELGSHFPVLTGSDCKKVWDLRKAGLGIVSNVPGDEKPVAVIEDTAVAVEDLPAFIAQFNQILKTEFGFQCVHYAHAGSGEIHLRPILNLKTKEGNRQFRQVAQRTADLVKQFQGSLSGEHGDGRLRGEFLEQMVGRKNYQLMKDVKRIWDPDGILNPNKIVDCPPMNSFLRYQPGQSTPDYPTVYRFEQEQGLLRASELCSGSGDCRKTHLAGGTMCPSFMATRSEKDSTRGRANVLRHMLTDGNANDKKHFDNTEVKEAMDLCLSCKGCQHECPSNVDIAKLKGEFLQGYYDVNGVPARAKRIAEFADKMKLASKVPWLFNFLISSSLTSGLLKRFLGFSTNRTLPRLASETLRGWFQKRDTKANGRSVLFFCDEFTNFNDVEVGKKAILLLESLGYTVKMPEHAESGRASLSKGLIRRAKGFANKNVELFSDLVSTEVPLVGIEPSAILTFRDEYLNLADSAKKAKKLSENVFLLEEFLAKEYKEKNISRNQFISEKRTIYLHGHCHQKAISSVNPSMQSLQIPQNYYVKNIPSGCCGMAGSFGYEKEHYDVSMQIGELVLFPAIRNKVGDSLIAAPGTSCRHQISDGTGRTALHPAEILYDALNEDLKNF